jgi:hypothetical protein
MNAHPKLLSGVVVLLAAAICPVAWAQSPSLDSLSIMPPAPTIADAVLVQAGGTHNTSGNPTIRTESRRIGNDIRMDVLIEETFVGAPPQINPWTQTVNFGTLPAGAYNVDARLFWRERAISPEFPDPWPFPDSFGLPLFPNANGMLSATFAVVPEPSTALWLAAGLLGFVAVRFRRT